MLAAQQVCSCQWCKPAMATDHTALCCFQSHAPRPMRSSNSRTWKPRAASRLARSATLAAGSTCALPWLCTRCGVPAKRHRLATFAAGNCLQQRCEPNLAHPPELTLAGPALPSCAVCLVRGVQCEQNGLHSLRRRSALPKENGLHSAKKTLKRTACWCRPPGTPPAAPSGPGSRAPCKSGPGAA